MTSDLNSGVKLLPHLELASGRGASCGVDQVVVDVEDEPVPDELRTGETSGKQQRENGALRVERMAN